MAEAAAAAAFAKSSAIFVGKTAAHAAISYLVRKALGRLSAEDEDLRGRLTAKLPAIEAVFCVADQPQVREDAVMGPWLWQFRNAMQEAEDALDELEFLDLEREVRDRRGREAKDWRVRVSSRLPSIGTGIRQSLSAARGGGTTKGRLKDALKRLDLVLENAKKFLATMGLRLQSSSCDDQGHVQDLASRRETTRELTTVCFGRRNEKEAIVEWLGVQAPELRDHELSVCAIVGGGGMGKTTLAQLVCQDKEVKGHFGDMIIWVHVSNRFDPKVLVRRILGSINRNKASAEALDPLQSDLTKELVTKRFLLVLDDAWEDTVHERWEQFFGPLRHIAPVGGRILLTTRMGSVADAVKRQMPGGYKCLELRGLDQEDTLKLFNHHAFGHLTHTGNSELQLIGEQIARKLRGCPFIAKVIGQQLRDNTDYSKWKTILNQDIQQFDEIGPRIMDMLRLSYQNLTYEGQLCFRYCSIFPPHYKFKMEEMVEMWMGSGLILQRENSLKNHQDIARGHFNILSQKSFFSLVPRELHADPSEDYYVVPELMYAFACSVSSEECSRLQAADHNTNIFPGVRHLYIEGVNSEIINIISQSEYLRTLIISNEENSIQQELLHDLKKAIKGRTSLRLLKLCGNGLSGMNNAIAELKHLRYISMSATEESNLCDLFKLYHLEVLRILKIEKESKVSSIDLSNLPHLQKLHLPKNALSRIPHIGRLTTLRELNGFSVKKIDGHKITELRDLRKLQKVIVLDVQNVGDYSEASSAELDKKMDMKVLSLEWSSDQATTDDQILNKLIPDSNLKHLIISGYNGIKPPMWMEIPYLSNLVYLKLDGCVEWDNLPPLGSLWQLKHVFLENLPKLKYIVRSFYGSDAYSYRGKWLKGSRPEELPPHLITFVVKDCPELLELPDLPFSLRHLGIDAVGMSNLPTMCHHKGLKGVSTVEPQLSVLHIESCDLLISVDGCFLQEEHYKALTVLKLFRCHALSSLPVAADFLRIYKLESVEITECNSLSSLGGLGALSYLRSLKIEHCDNLVTTSSSRPPRARASAESSYLVLETLEIDDYLLLLSNPLRNLCRTKRLIISGKSEMSELPEEWLLQNSSHLEHIEISDAPKLETLPEQMDVFHCLRSLLVYNTPLLQSLPDMPPKLWVLIISGCSAELNEKCQSGGSEWIKIHQVHNCHIYPLK